MRIQNMDIVRVRTTDSRTCYFVSSEIPKISKKPPELPQEKLHRDNSQKSTIPMWHCGAKETRKKNLFQMFLHSGYTRSSIRRSPKEKHYRETIVEKTRIQTVLLYIKHIFDLTTRLIKPHEVEVAHEPTRTIRKILS